MARKRGRATPIAIDEPTPDTRRRGPLVNDRHWDFDNDDPMKGGQMHCSDVMAGRGVAHEAPAIRTVSAFDVRRLQHEEFAEREDR